MATSGAWIDLTDERPRRTKKHTSKPLRALDTQSEEHQKTYVGVVDAIEHLREAAVRSKDTVRKAFVDVNSVAPSGSPAADIAELADTAAANVRRVRTIVRSIDATRRLANARSALEKWAALAEAMILTTRNAKTAYPASVREASQRAINRVRQQLRAGTMYVSQASSSVQAEITGLTEDADRAATPKLAGLIRTMLSTRDRSMEVLRRLSGELRAVSTYSELVGHIAALEVATDPTEIDREAECVLLGFGDLVGARLTAVDSSSTDRTSLTVPPELLERISNPARRQELITMSAARAADLLVHTRRAMDIARATGDEDRVGRLGVVISILEIRAGGASGGVTTTHQQTATADRLTQRWKLQRATVVRAVEAVRMAASAVVAAYSEITSAVSLSTRKMKEALARAVGGKVDECTSAIEQRTETWRLETMKALLLHTNSVLEGATRFSKATQDALEVITNVGLVLGVNVVPTKRRKPLGTFDDSKPIPVAGAPIDLPSDDDDAGSDGADGEEEYDDDEEENDAEADDDAQLRPPTKRSISDSFASFRPDTAASGEGAEEHDDDDGSEDEMEDGRTLLLKKAYRTVFDGFETCIRFAVATIGSNTDGTLRSIQHVNTTIEPEARKFKEVIASAR